MARLLLRGEGSLNILICNGGDDTGSIAIRIKEAFDRHAPGWNVRCVRMTDNYAMHTPDLYWWRDADLVRDLYDKCDVVHWMEHIVHNFGSRKPTVLHHHGEIYRDEFQQVIAQAANSNAVQIVATVDLLSVNPGTATWLPAPYPLDYLASFRKPNQNSMRTVFHSPTYTERKGTAELQQAVANLQEKGVPVALEFVMYRPQDYVYERKGQADIVFDNLYGYGLNAVEAFGMGIPVIGGLVESRWANPQVRVDIMKEIGYIPFYEIDQQTLEPGLELMVMDEGLRKTWRNIGLEYAYEFHDERKIVKRLQAIYQQAKEQFVP